MDVRTWTNSSVLQSLLWSSSPLIGSPLPHLRCLQAMSSKVTGGQEPQVLHALQRQFIVRCVGWAEGQKHPRTQGTVHSPRFS